jgi:dihydrofolate synthase/folylpolyglutamate synthase
MKDLETRYQETLDWIYSWIDFSMNRHVDEAHRFFKLDRMNRLMSLLDWPNREYPCVHVAGTKGKGSTASFIASALRASGYKTGLYTSPHLEDFRERIQIDGEQIPVKDLVDLADKMRPRTELVNDVTTFELTTAIAFQYFADQNIDIAVLEVGLGGRLDATNIVDPLVSVITPVSYDHMNVLGNTLTEIAHEKAGIIKANRHVIIAPQAEEAEAEILRMAALQDSPAIVVDQAYSWQSTFHTLDSQHITIENKNINPRDENALVPIELDIPLLGQHQADNAATSIAALEVLRQAGFSISKESLKQGFQNVHWETRFEILRKNPPLIADAAHNGDSMQKLRQTLDDYFPDLPFILLFGASADKSLTSMLDIIMPRVEAVVCTQSIHPRAADAFELQKLIKPYGKPSFAESTAEAGLAKALELAGNDKGIIATGSLFLAAAARAIWRQNNQ